MKIRWLDRHLGLPGPFLALCTTPEQFRLACEHLDAPAVPQWVIPGASATMHTFEHVERGIVCIVCISDWRGRDPIEVAGMLVHEAVHVWQQWCDDVGERSPGAEQEAYAIQCISQELMAEFRRQVRQGRRSDR